ncbi:hypothetical protein [Arthrobacter sp. VKM Ac-2550]|uniref:hypothetical protein n=1 Tax=Crystallibacter permensis TaxID=1938888 RepID=UPI002226AA5F|nr:hypothetical protein [Arthrobacter sp. VKM Ac-2550]MCW2134020.1 hypothetical protein [Arthrobacter sp. VKM Ac-2550]
MSVPAPARNIQEFKTSPMTRLLLALDIWRRRAREASLGLPLGILAVTATFWLVVWLADHALQGSISPVGVLVRIYGTGAFVTLTLLMVAIAVWMIVQRLGYREVFFDGQDDSTEQPLPAPMWDSSIPDFTGQITKLVSSMDAPVSPLAHTTSTDPAVEAPSESGMPTDQPTTSSKQTAPSAPAAPAGQTCETAEPTTAAPATEVPTTAKRPAPAKSGTSLNAKAPAAKAATAKASKTKPLLKRKGRTRSRP